MISYATPGPDSPETNDGACDKDLTETLGQNLSIVIGVQMVLCCFKISMTSGRVFCVLLT